MMALRSSPAPALIGDSCLEDWHVIGSGGFGQIYKARHHMWCCDVAIKLLHFDDGKSSSLLREIDLMRQGSSPYVIQVLGVFRGHVASSGPSVQLGLVMEFMERGSLASLQETLHGAPPWPLIFRLAHQVALGMNFLHNLTPPLLHLDLKPSNVLLDSYLNAKLTDFGLSRVSHSFSRVSKKDSEEEGGTISYMPPEAFGVSYSPTRASDIYSYGILLWSIVTGKQPYANAMSSIVRLRIPQGDRPSMDDIRVLASGIAGLTRLMDLMEKCWQTKANERPSSYYCTTLTEELNKMHKHAIHDAVHQVLKKLDQTQEERLTERVQGVYISQPSGNRAEALTIHNDVPTGGLPVQEVAGHFAANQNKARSKEWPTPRPADMCDVDKTHSSPDYKIKPSSVHPIQLPSPSPSPRGSPKGRNIASQIGFRMNQYHRQISTPETSSGNAQLPSVNIHCSNVTGFQKGNYNTMHIQICERKRHPTAPSSVNHHHSGRW
ncbi:receptor-interacting serine/threonine-protein kinase 3 [Sphaeramia orbicularis]|uniref:Receptor-interacting serine/threonine-protein kinase 3-like n=1 Tax=Sphaeramia orbicularis TaxID=375764 RepID=A0A673BU98_9TELE|nr:receptor-interacting serine/threonine-protein kinase 3-like [Sphaeramia orbicularis]XP_030018652.1 receptor-interacting serine/threonine-protein kinase 3-like [Sphaeramia orbicularis]